MSLIPFQGQRPSSFSPDAFRTAQAAGRLARKFYDWYISQPSTAKTSSHPRLMPSKGGGRSARGGMQPRNTADLRVNPPVRTVPRGVPRTISNQVVWDKVQLDLNIAPSSGAITENNYRFALSDHPQFASWAALFDQWCIPEFSITFRSLEAPGGTGKMASLYTALDFDSVVALASIPGIQDFGTCQTDTLTTGTEVTRSVKPCIKSGASSAGGNQSFAVLERLWCDSALPQTVWHGIRSIVDATDLTQIKATATIYYAFRNQI